MVDFAALLEKKRMATETKNRQLATPLNLSDEEKALTVASDDGMLLAMYNAGLTEYDLQDFGQRCDIEKREMHNLCVIVQGLSESTFQGDYPVPARSLLFNFTTDARGAEPFGVFFSDESPVIRQARDQLVKNGGKPFIGRLVEKPSQTHRGQTYWTLERVALVFRSDGQLIDPNSIPAPR